MKRRFRQGAGARPRNAQVGCRPRRHRVHERRHVIPRQMRHPGRHLLDPARPGLVQHLHRPPVQQSTGENPFQNAGNVLVQEQGTLRTAHDQQRQGAVLQAQLSQGCAALQAGLADRHAHQRGLVYIQSLHFLVRRSDRFRAAHREFLRQAQQGVLLVQHRGNAQRLGRQNARQTGEPAVAHHRAGFPLGQHAPRLHHPRRRPQQLARVSQALTTPCQFSGVHADKFQALLGSHALLHAATLPQHQRRMTTRNQLPRRRHRRVNVPTRAARCHHHQTH